MIVSGLLIASVSAFHLASSVAIVGFVPRNIFKRREAKIVVNALDAVMAVAIQFVAQAVIFVSLNGSKFIQLGRQ